MVEQRLRDYRAFKKSLECFDWLKQTVPGATDVDLLIHCDGRFGDAFLMIEGKAPSAEVPRGQLRLHDGLRRQGWTVVVAHGPNKEGLYRLSGDWKGTCGKAGLRRKVDKWWHEALTRCRGVTYVTAEALAETVSEEGPG